ncbi:MAG: hypothetical protein JSR85_07715 [Proteobacteria bacterium]|nr:hypothetical protein [Pseudomonadota bacterium]
MKFRIASLLALLSSISFLHSPALGMDDESFSSFVSSKPREVLTEERRSLEEFLSLQDYPKAFNSLRSQLATSVPDEEIVKHLITSNKYTKSWSALDREDQIWLSTKIINEARKIELDDFISKQDYASAFNATRKIVRADLPDEEVVKYLLESNGYRKWAELSEPNKIAVTKKITTQAQQLELDDFISKQDYASAFNATRKSVSADLPDEEIVKFLLASNGYKKWNNLSFNTKAKAFSVITGKRYDGEGRLAPRISRLDDVFTPGENVFFGERFATLKSKHASPYDERSELYSIQGASYPRVPMIHTYHHDLLPAPFAAVFSEEEVSVPGSLKGYLEPEQETAFFFNVQKMETGRPLSLQEIDIIRRRESGEVFTRPEDINISNGVPRYYIDAEGYKLLPHTSFKPQYAIFPDAPAMGAETKRTPVEWTVVPGGEGHVIPEQGEKDELWTEKEISVHPAGLPLVNPDTIQDKNEKERVLRIMEEQRIIRDTSGLVNMDDINGVPDWQRLPAEAQILSGDSMHLSGIVPTQSVDFYSLAKAQDKAFVTYHWTLTPRDFEKFNEKLARSTNLRELIEGLKTEASLSNMLGELKKYVGYIE